MGGDVERQKEIDEREHMRAEIMAEEMNRGSPPDEMVDPRDICNCSRCRKERYYPRRATI
jgi:hypothetical protein